MLNSLRAADSSRMEMFEEWYRESSIFVDERKLSFDYVPTKLPHRGEQLKKLGILLKGFVATPGANPVKVVLLGPVGTGKTVVAKYFGIQVEKFSAKREYAIKYAHVNCHKDRTLFLIMQRVAQQLDLKVPRRGFSSHELMHVIWNYLKTGNSFLVLTIDEADYLVRNAGEEVLYDLTRISEDMRDQEYFRTALIFIFRSMASLAMLDDSIKSTLTHNIIKFDPYTSRQIEDILWSRIVDEGAIREEAVDEEVVKLIGDLVGYDRGGRGDARLAIELLWRAGKIAEASGERVIRVEHVRKAYSSVFPAVSEGVLKSLKRHELLLLYALIRVLVRTGESRIPMGVVEREYRAICEELGERARGHTTVWEYAKALRDMGVIDIRLSSRGFRGRTSLLSIPYAPLEPLKRQVEQIIESSPSLA